jgi:PPOX class probable F420-dependent enzyme
LTDPALTVEPVISDELRSWLVEKLRFPVLAVVTPGGSPSQSLMWFDLDPDEPNTIVMNSTVARAKTRYLRHSPRASLCFFEEGYRWVALQGRVELDDEPAQGLAVIRALARRYDSDPEVFNGQHRVTIRLRVEKTISHD